ncbi:MAG: hypothetical protein ACFFEU_09665 [Candidatus Thorarchaeota archaeon]
MSSEERDDNYWMGVRDALRMVDSFLRWARKHPKDAKTIDDFLAEGLVAAAKRCKSCLGKELGMKYGSDDPEVDEPREIKEPTHFEEPIPDVDSEVEDIPYSDEELVASEVAGEHGNLNEVSDEDETPPAEPVSIEEIETSVDEEESISADELAFEGMKRDFLADFPLDEPVSAVDKEDDTKIVPSTPEDVMRAVLAEADEEELMPPEAEDLEVETYDDVLEVLESPSSTEESPPVSAPKRELWSPYDEPPLQDDDEDDEIISTDAEDEQVSEELEDTPAVKPPPPPPPPETDETEEERRRRARRLFFGT